MVVSAILLTALAPITGALFGASYGTSIRIGYEIIFPALFGDMINEQKNNKITVSQEEGAKRTIKALHTMFTATGGASAMEFGIEQGIEMAKKKTESPAVQSMIALNLGLTDEQIRRRGRGAGSNFNTGQSTDVSQVVEADLKPQGDIGDFKGLTFPEIKTLFQKMDRNDHAKSLVLLSREFGDNHLIVRLMTTLYRTKFPATTTQLRAGTAQVRIDRFTTDKPTVIARIKQLKAQITVQQTSITRFQVRLRGLHHHVRSSKAGKIGQMQVQLRTFKSLLADAEKKLLNINTLARNR